MAFQHDLDSLVLGVLEDGAAHGYEIARRIKNVSDQALAVGEGRLYPSLHGLERDGYLAADWVPQPGKPDRKVYRLTEEGTRELAKRRNQWAKFRSAVEAVLNPKRPRLEGHGG